MSHENPQEDAFDRLSRILATPMPRRQALGLVGTGLLAMILPRNASGQSKADKKVRPGTKISALKMPVKNFVMQQASAYDIVRQLRRYYAVPVSFIAAPSDVFPVISAQFKFNVNVSAGTVQDVLKQVTSQNPVYKWQELQGRLILLPVGSKYDVFIKGINIKEMPRSDAAEQFVDYLKEHVSGFDKFYFIMLGDPRARIFTQPVSLAMQGTVLQLLLELLGENTMSVFNVTIRYDGVWTLGLNEVAPVIVDPSDQNSKATALSLNTLAPAALASANAAPNSNPNCRPYAANYALASTPSCPSGLCGSIAVYNASSYSICPGDDCSGESTYEDVSRDGTSTCSPDDPAPGCTVDNPCPGLDKGGTCTGCTDTYRFCFAPSTTACTYTVDQILYAGNTIVQHNKITISVPAASGNTCSKATLSPPVESPAHTLAQCCGANPPASGLGSKTFCKASEVCVTDSETALSFCCPGGTAVACDNVCCAPKQKCFTDQVTGHKLCCPSDASAACNGVCCSTLSACIKGTCCAPAQITSDSKTCCPSGQTPYGTICCTTGQNNCNGKCCANICCAGVCCSAGQVCVNGVCCGKPAPQARMSAEAVNRGWYATDDLSQCCAPGNPPCGNICCPSGSICCGGSCCAGTCDNTGVCIPTPGENK